MERALKKWGNAGGAIASFFLIWKMVRKHLPLGVLRLLNRWLRRLSVFFNPYIQISVHEYIKKNMRPHPAYAAVEAYLGAKSAKEATRLKAEIPKDGSAADGLSMDENQRVDDVFRGAEVQWVAGKAESRLVMTDKSELMTRSYKLIFHKKFRSLVIDSYLDHVIKSGDEIRGQSTKQKLYTNGHGRTPWSHIVFDHPASFEKLAMDAGKKKEIVDDLIAFKEGKDLYARIGKAWKRGYLLYGPPGTGKSIMVAAMANFLNYDIYDLELTSVSDNTELRQLLAETTSKSIVVIEDIDCSLDLAKNRKENTVRKTNENTKKKSSKNNNGERQVTLSGLLNFIDGLWSTCTGERVIVFTSNYVEKLDPALTRRGRMDMHIKMSYCTFEGFKVLARNYLALEDHPMFGSIELLMTESRITPADVAENLMFQLHENDIEKRLENLIEALKQAKEQIISDQVEQVAEANESFQFRDG
ncbi:hypothetical protein DM860_011370 [Cuscuta australis]|uniref:AAA+ ATPase domain-containing protein n=1 Tax=Cuscuta australis TaxID=267555 RepID=A0A328DPQ1_9ASTE|nr:hypothetical protein DM860_011370 [Cuscuta australis]